MKKTWTLKEKEYGKTAGLSKCGHAKEWIELSEEA